MSHALFQKFSSESRPDLSARRIAALRAELARRKVDGLLLPRADIFQGEYIPASENRLNWLTAFTGSAGFAIVLKSRAALFVDGRYTVQARQEVDHKAIKVVPLAEKNPDEWLRENARGKVRIGYDPALFTARGLKRFELAAASAGFDLVALDGDPFAPIWDARPVAPATPVVDHPLSHAGEDAADKIARLQARMASDKADALVVSECPSLNWLFNIRAGDVPHLPILRAFALVPREGRPVLFVDPKRLDAGLAKRLAGIAEIVRPVAEPLDGRVELAERLKALATAGASIRLDEDTAPSHLARLIETAGGKAITAPCPLALMKSPKDRKSVV